MLRKSLLLLALLFSLCGASVAASGEVELANQLLHSIFPGNYYAGSQPRIEFEIDPLPAVEELRLRCRPLAVMAGGKNMLDPAERKRHWPIRMGGDRVRSYELLLRPGIDPVALGEARLLFYILRADGSSTSQEVSFDLNGGRPLSVDDGNAGFIPARRSLAPILTEKHFTLPADWQLRPRFIDDQLHLNFPVGYMANAQWRLRFFRGERVEMAPYRVVGDLVYLPAGVDAVRGEVSFDRYGEPFSLEMAKGRGGRATLPALGIELEFVGNTLLISEGRRRILHFRVFDKKGVSLRRGQTVRKQGARRVYYFWGTPARVQLILSTAKPQRSVAAVVKGGTSALAARIDTIDAVAGALKRLDRVRRSFTPYYSEDIAGLFYMDAAQTAGVDAALFAADRDGGAFFNYEPKPFRGYLFTLAAGRLGRGGTQNNYLRKLDEVRYRFGERERRLYPFEKHRPLVALPQSSNDPVLMLIGDELYASSTIKNGAEIYRPHRISGSSWLRW